MKTSFLIALALALIVVASAEPPDGYKLAWSDEFDGKALDRSKWNYRTGPRHWSEQLPENVSVSNGCLRLALKKEDRNKLHYTAGGVISKPTFKYGYYEARFRVPPGAGWHTSFWMMRNGGGAKEEPVQELDVCENDSVKLTSYGVNVHRQRPLPHISYGHKSVKTPDLSADFHVWGCEFTPTEIKYFFEGKLVQTVDATKIPHGEQSIWLTSIASQLGGTKSVDDAKLPAVAEFDWVRFYKKSVTSK